MQRRTLLKLAAATASLPLAAQAAAPMVEIWKDPNCGCCQDWVKHLNKNGFATRVHDEGNGPARERLGIPAKLGSCHTGRVGGYAIEGHVPAREMHRLLKEKPKAVGLAVPGMPIGSPGMDGPAYGDQRDAYDVLLVLADGSTRVFQSYR
ncbi:metal-binding protein [Variovorax sp. RO1]|uniref:DUF411 domain-containing protein n=1 Tax=unclassified Variovorax TaxID=663243 RepID=UPI000C17B22A|nr:MULTISPECIES: DUF411 domain-containing protein [unclassified Variovorax]MDZ4361744.1 DUF411 domain-containing protein [Variovorax sp.]PIF74160.1 hypothetical protein CLU95_1281 [Variovorax sp. 54]PLC06784.1 metal-binding protein [Variovorax sp. RO1]QOF76882.1 DUF411 domain-containing protein [Variovorax sp. 38R]